MRIAFTVSLGLALVLACASAPASAIGPQAWQAVSGSGKPVSERCFRWRHRCREIHPAAGWRFRRCLALHGCS